MATLAENYVIAGSDYKLILQIGSLVYPIMTAESIGWSIERESETIHAIGQEEPIANKRNNAKYSGSLVLQVGEMETILRAALLPECSSISGAVLAITSLSTANFAGLVRTFSGINVLSESLDIKNKDKQTLINLKWEALTMSNNQAAKPTEALV